MKDKRTEKSKGYAFIEFEHKKDFNDAYKEADGMKVDGRRVQVDYERGRTTKDWLPRRYGGGKGKTRTNKDLDGILEKEYEVIKKQYIIKKFKI